MGATADQELAELRRANAELRDERDAAQAALAQRNSEYGERIEHQSAAIDVLKAMAASPGDPRPVFEVIVRRARDLCDAYGATLAQAVGGSIVLGAYVVADETLAERHEASFPRPVAADTMFGRAILAREPVQLPDIAADQAHALREDTLRGHVRALAAVPLMRDGEAIGAIIITRQQTGEFSRAQIELLQVFAKQAVIAITSAETYRELQQALEQQTATAEVLQVINSSPGDLAPVFDAMLGKAMRLCEATNGYLFTYDGDRFHPAAINGDPRLVEWHRQLGPFQPAADTGLDKIRRGDRLAHIPDVREADAFRTVPAAEIGGFRSSLTVALRQDEVLLGALSVYRQEVRPFTDKQIALLQNFAAQAVIAMENARLLTEQREALEQQTATAEVLQIINASPGNLAPVFDAMLDRAIRLCEGVQGTLWMFDGERMRATATAGYSSELAKQLSEWREIHPFQRRLSHGERAFQIIDLAAEELYHSGNPLTKAAVDIAGIHTVVFVALVKDAVTLGGLTIGRREVHTFTDKQIALLENFATQAVIAMENARLLTEQREALDQQTATAEVLQVINSSPGDLTPVFEAMLEKATRLCEASFGTLNTYDGEHLRAGAAHRVPAALVEWAQRNPLQFGPETVLGRVVGGEDLVHTVDLAATEAYQRGDPGRRALVDLGGARSHLIAALRKEGALLGTITVYRKEARPFSDKQIALLQNFAAQAVIAMENARLLNETRKALEQQTATAEVLQVINSSPGDLGPVFDAMLERAVRLCDATYGHFRTFDGQGFPLAAVRGDPNLIELARQRTRYFQPGPHNPISSFMRGERLVHIADAAEDEAYSADQRWHELVDTGACRSVLAVALRKENALLGYISVYRHEVRPFSNKQIALLQNFAAQAVIAMENARLITETREALEQQTATSEVLGVINASPGDLAPVFDAMLEKAMRLCGAAFGVLRSFDGQRVHTLASRGVPAEYAERFARNAAPDIDLVPGASPARALQTGQPVQILDVREGTPYRSGIAGARAIADLGGARTILHVPLLKDQVSVGLLTFYRQEVREFTDKQTALLQGFAAQAVIAMENARLITEQREALEQQTATAEVLQVINSSPGDLKPVFDAILEKAHTLCGADLGSLASYDGELFHRLATHGYPPEYLTVVREPNKPLPFAQKLLDGERFVHEADLTVTALDDPFSRGAVEILGTRTILLVPLKKERRLLGYINAQRREVRPFSQKEITLLENFAAQAVVAMENARLLNEQREALERQTATAEVLGIINANPGNLTPVFDTILEKAHALCGAAFGSLYIFDGEHFHSAAHHNVPAAYAEYRERNPPKPIPGTGPFRLLQTKRPFQDLDIMSTEAYRTGSHANSKAMVELGGIRTIAAVPLLKDEALVGMITMFRQEVRAFSDKQIALLESFAGQAVIAMENARLLNEVRQRQEELRVTFENMGDGVALFDETRHLVASNQQFQDMLGVPDEVISSRPAFADYIRYLANRGEYGLDPEDQVAHLLTLGGQPAAFERTRPNGRIIEIRSNPVPAGGFVVIYSDITDRKRNEEELRAARDAAEEASRTIEGAYRDLKAAQASLIQAEKMASLGQLTAGIAHEIKNPLNFVNNFAELSGDLLDELNDAVAGHLQAEIDELTATLKGNLAKIAEHGRRADGIVRSMLEHSRGSSGERRAVDLNALVDEALNLAYHGARAQDQSFSIKLQREFGESIAPIMLAPQDVTRVLLNLFSNGFYAARERQRIEATPSFEPTLKVSTHELDDAVEIHVRDNGIGIPPEINDHLFQPFFTTKPTGEGTGLGLSMSYDIVTQQHGGTITVESEVGEYSEFTVRLPRNP